MPQLRLSLHHNSEYVHVCVCQCECVTWCSTQIRGYPTIKFFPAGPKEMSSARDYDGGRTSGDIVQWALNHYTELLPPPEVNEVRTPVSFPLHSPYKKSFSLYG